MTPTTKELALDFDKIEVLRRSMLLTVQNMADFYGVSPETYYNWQRGKYPRASMEQRIKSKTRLLLYAVAEHGWPSPDVIAADPPDRYKMLLALLEEKS